MLNPDHPTAMLRDAWHRIRLDAIRAAAIDTIAELEDGTRADLLARYGCRRAPEPMFGAMAQALLVCCNEVRVEAGLPEVVAGVAVPVREADPDWKSVYVSELERYRMLAGRALMRRLPASA
ncbi:MAG: hypothetical protein PVI30_11610 [Myxococcales bacterium]|jgi:hypothetical protein